MVDDKDIDFDALFDLLAALEDSATSHGAFDSEVLRGKAEQARVWRDALGALLMDADPGPDLSSCAYYLSMNSGVCSFGCREEPECYTGEPYGGWPAMRAVSPAAKVLRKWLPEKESVEAALELKRGFLLRRNLPASEDTDD